MGFFETFWTWLNGQMASYIGDNTARVASALEPAIVTLGTLYVMVWGFLQMTGRVEEPVLTGVKRILIIGLVFGTSLRLWLYHSVIVTTFYQAPSQFAAVVVGSNDPVRVIDSIWTQGGSVAAELYDRGGILSDFGSRVAGVIVWCLMGLLCVYTMFLIGLASVAVAVLLALGPLFISMLLFDGTRRLFMAWMSQLINYGLVTVLTVMVAALLLHIVESFVSQTAALGGNVHTVDILNMVLLSVLVFLFMRQVMPVAAALAGGVGLSTFGTTSRVMASGLRFASELPRRVMPGRN